MKTFKAVFVSYINPINKIEIEFKADNIIMAQVKAVIYTKTKDHKYKIESIKEIEKNTCPKCGNAMQPDNSNVLMECSNCGYILASG